MKAHSSARLLIPCAIILLAAAGGLAAPIIVTNGPYRCTFYNNGDSDGYNTGAADWTATQMGDVAAGIATWTAHIADIPVRLLDLHLFWYNWADSTLGNSYNPIVGDTVTAWTMTELIWREGYDYDIGGIDASLTFDIDAAGYAWNFGAGAPAAGEIDFRSVTAHEFGHCIGFVSTYMTNSDAWWSGGLTAFDQHLEDSAGNRAVAGGVGVPGNFNQNDDPVYFTGDNAKAAYGGNPVPIYAPAAYAPGSSLTHLDEASFPTALMTPFLGLGQSARTLSAVERGMLRDMGWTLAIPEPNVILLVFEIGRASCRERV